MRASLGSSPVQHEIGEQGLQTGDINCRHGGIARHQQEVTQQVDVQGRDHQESFCVAVSFKPTFRSFIQTDCRFFRRAALRELRSADGPTQDVRRW